MANRLTKIYTRSGDQGQTRLGNGEKLHKDHLRIEIIGCVDELNSYLGSILSNKVDDDTQQTLSQIQHQLFDLGAELCMPGTEKITQQAVQQLEDTIDRLNAQLQPLAEFILPGGCRAASDCHVARSVCRRAERRLISLYQTEQGPMTTLRYINRLSDLLFVLARHLNKTAGVNDVLWRPAPASNSNN